MVTNILETAVLVNSSDNAPLPLDAAAVSDWTFINDWRVEAQPDDRPLAVGAAAQGSGSPSARRSSARRKHQAMYKEWSQGRNE